MKLGFKILSAAALAFALSACGGSGAKFNSKDDAANAAFNAFKSGAPTNQPALLAALQNAASVEIGTKVSCRNGHGQVAYSLVASGDQTGGTFGLKLSFDGCETGDYKDAKGTLVPVTVDGDVTYDFTGTATNTTGSFEVALKGNLDFSGGIDDSLDIDFTLGANADSVAGTYSLSLQGTIKTNEQTYTYSNTDTITATPGTFTGTDTTGNT